MPHLATLMIVLIAGAPLPIAKSDDFRAEYSTEIEAPLDEVWSAFTTSQGLKSWMAPVVEIDFKVNGVMKANYNAQGKIGDETTIENTILAYDPMRMLVLKATKFPVGFPFAKVAQNNWSVFYFQGLAPNRTKITVVGLGYTSDKLSQQMRSFFANANKQSLEKLETYLKGRK